MVIIFVLITFVWSVNASVAEISLPKEISEVLIIFNFNMQLLTFIFKF